MSQKGLLIVLSGPSGSGKDTVLKKVVSLCSNVKLSISATTRKPRKGEKQGEHYHFISRDRFLKLVSCNQMLEYAEYCNNFYGTPKKQVLDWMNQGRDVILEIEVKGACKVIKENPFAVSIFIMPPSFSVLEQRLKNRGTESEDLVINRLKTAKEEIKCALNYDYIVINDSLEECAKNIINIINAERFKSVRMKDFIEKGINNEQNSN